MSDLEWREWMAGVHVVVSALVKLAMPRSLVV
jgi:hypothetical protein